MGFVDKHQGSQATESVTPMSFIAGLPPNTPLVGLHQAGNAVRLTLQRDVPKSEIMCWPEPNVVYILASIGTCK